MAAMRMKDQLAYMIASVNRQLENELEERLRMNQYEQTLATRKQYRNVMKAQSSSLLLLFMLAAATAALIAWCIRLVQGA